MPIRQDPISAIITPALMKAFVRTVSSARWGTYLTAGGFSEKAALHLYLWNIAMGQSFLFPLQAVEVALRNVISTSIISELGVDWWRDIDCRPVLGEDRWEEIDKATRRLRRKYGTDANGDQLVASLMLGFWASMLKRDCNAWLWDKQVVYAFPNLKLGQRIRDVSEAAHKVQDLRNRIFHHEPLIGRNISGDYAEILKLLGWICPETREWVRANTSVPKVMRERPRN